MEVRRDLTQWLKQHATHKVASLLQTQFKVTPANQSTSELDALLDLTPWLDITDLVSEIILPKLLHTFIKWTEYPSCNFTQVWQWYNGWKSLLPQSESTTEAMYVMCYALY